MFEIAWSELFLVILVAIVVVGPKELPGMLRGFGRMMGKLRRSADDFRRQFDESVREAGGEDLQRELNSLRYNNPLNQIRDTIEEAAREASQPPRLPTAESFIDKPEEPPVIHETMTEPEIAPAPKPAETAASPLPLLPEASPPAKEANGNATGHEPLANGQHRP